MACEEGWRWCEEDKEALLKLLRTIAELLDWPIYSPLREENLRLRERNAQLEEQLKKVRDAV